MLLSRRDRCAFRPRFPRRASGHAADMGARALGGETGGALQTIILASLDYVSHIEEI